MYGVCSWDHVVCGGCCTPQGASTDARVYVTLYSAHEEGLNTGELRLLDKDTLGKPFGRDAMDLFVV